MAGLYPPPLLMARPLKKVFFCGFPYLSGPLLAGVWLTGRADNLRIRSAWKHIIHITYTIYTKNYYYVKSLHYTMYV